MGKIKKYIPPSWWSVIAIVVFAFLLIWISEKVIHIRDVEKVGSLTSLKLYQGEVVDTRTVVSHKQGVLIIKTKYDDKNFIDVLISNRRELSPGYIDDNFASGQKIFFYKITVVQKSEESLSDYGGYRAAEIGILVPNNFATKN